ncbi:DUF3887 domain-containing protein [Clostridium sp. NSJ-145]|uniref:DUF3887 domain-containing protein n=1 Tax=Clostridium sp. NSJ-145 TaxID=2897777 RepID=UPI001E453559|nr:DUF3887 domain-containing protein [Clostridium sp. NSJ-145]MCD2500690.1 DUF3887 domain-containing protein [Clostridium sp. NSJ-145]
MKKFIKVLSIILCLFMFVSCSAGKLSDAYNEDEVKAAAEEVINELNDKNYDGILEDSSDELKISLPDNKLQETWEGFSKDIGKFNSISNMTLAEKNGYAVAITNVKYDNKKVTFTLSFNKEMKLAGIYMK